MKNKIVEKLKPAGQLISKFCVILDIFIAPTNLLKVLFFKCIGHSINVLISKFDKACIDCLKFFGQKQFVNGLESPFPPPTTQPLQGLKELILNSFLNIMNKMTIIYLLKYNIKSLGAENIKLLYIFSLSFWSSWHGSFSSSVLLCVSEQPPCSSYWTDNRRGNCPGNKKVNWVA